MKISCIYIIRSKCNPYRVYIGSAIDFINRKSCHVSQLKNNKHHSKKMQRHVNKYGIDDLSFDILERVFIVDDILNKEQYYIDLLNPYFNTRPKAASNLGYKFGPMSIEYKAKISAAGKGRIVSEETRNLRKVGISKYTIDEVFIAKYDSWLSACIAENCQVRPITEQNITVNGFVWVSENQSLPNFDLINDRINKAKAKLRKPVLQIDKNGQLVAEFEGVRIACEKTGIDHRSISQVAVGNPVRKTAGGFIWKYKETTNV